MYKSAAPHPNGQAAAEEMFTLGVIPSDTDFRIFRDYGHIPGSNLNQSHNQTFLYCFCFLIEGMDFAHVTNGFRYHTKYDHIDYLPPAVLQRTGDNILALVKKMANSDELTNTQV